MSEDNKDTAPEETTDQATPADETTEAPVADPNEKIHVDPNSPYKLTISKPGAEEKVVNVPRNMVKLQQALLAELEDETLESQEDIQVTVALSGHPVVGEGQVAQLDKSRTLDAVLPNLSGTANNVLVGLAAEILTPEQAMIMLERYIESLSKVSDTLGVIITLVSATKGVGGKTILNRNVKIEESDIIRLAEGADGHVGTFRAAMQQQGVVFPSDTTIVTPGSTDFKPPPLSILS